MTLEQLKNYVANQQSAGDLQRYIVRPDEAGGFYAYDPNAEDNKRVALSAGQVQEIQPGVYAAKPSENKTSEYATALREALSKGTDLSKLGYGADYQSAAKFLEDVGGQSGKDAAFLPANPVGYAGGFKFDPNFGSTYYRDLANQAGRSLGLTPEQVLKIGSQYTAEQLYDPSGRKQAIGFSDFGRGLIDRLGAGRNPADLQGLYAANEKLYKSLQDAAAIQSDTSGFFKQGLKTIANDPVLLASLAAVTGGLSGPALGGLLGTSSTIGAGVAGGAAAGGVSGGANGGLGGAVKGAAAGGLLGGAGGALTQGFTNLYNGLDFTSGMNGSPLKFDYSLTGKGVTGNPYQGINMPTEGLYANQALNPNYDLFSNVTFPQQGLSATLPANMDFGSGVGQGIAPENPLTGIRDFGGTGLEPGLGIEKRTGFDLKKITEADNLRKIAQLLGGTGATKVASGATSGRYVPVEVPTFTFNRGLLNPVVDYAKYGQGPEQKFFTGLI